MSNVYSFPARVYGPTRYIERFLPRGKRIVLIVLSNRTIEETYLRDGSGPGDHLRVDALYERFTVVNL